VGVDTETEEGTTKVMVAVEPVPGVTVAAVVVTAVPPLLGVRVTVTLAGEIDPLGNPEPVTDTVVRPGSADVGLVAEPSTKLASFTVKPFVIESVSPPVTTVTLLAPNVAVSLITMLAVALVALTTVTGPAAPAAAPPTEMFGPKAACDTPLTKFVYLPLIVTVRVCPCSPELGERDVIVDVGLTVSAEEFELWNGVPVVVVPEIETS